jgi:hypothetical protein
VGKIKQFNKRKFIVIFFAITLLGSLGVGLIVKNRASASDLDVLINGYCAEAYKQLPGETSQFPQFIQEDYNKSYSNPDRSTGSLAIDLDTYKNAARVSAGVPYLPGWNNLKRSDKEDVFRYLKEKTPQILNEIITIYGPPYHPNKIYIIVFNDFGSSRYNEWNFMEGISGQYIAYYNTILLTIDDKSTKEDILQSYIHEIVHTYNDGSLIISAWEEGLAEGVSQLIFNKILNINNTIVPSSHDPDFLAAPFGVIYGNSDLTSTRYGQSALAMLDVNKADNQFIKRFRTNFKKFSGFNKALQNPQLFYRDTIFWSICDLLHKRATRIDNYLNEMQNIFRDSLPATIGGLDKLKWLSKNGVLNPNPVSGPYISVLIDQTTGHLTSYSHIKYRSVADVLLQYYYSITGKDGYSPSIAEGAFPFLRQGELFDAIQQTQDYSSLYQNFGQWLEYPADIALKIYMDPFKTTTYHAQVGSGSLNGYYSTNLKKSYFASQNYGNKPQTQSWLPQNYQGDIYLEITGGQKTKSYKGEVLQDCFYYVIDKYCWPETLQATTILNASAKAYYKLAIAPTYQITSISKISAKDIPPYIFNPSYLVISSLTFNKKSVGVYNFSFTLSSSACLTPVEIQNITGTTVRQLSNCPCGVRSPYSCKIYPAGKSSIAFDGKDQNGKTLPPGIYIFNITAQDPNYPIVKYSKTISFQLP